MADLLDLSVFDLEDVTNFTGPLVAFLKRAGEVFAAQKHLFIVDIGKPFQGAGHPDPVLQFHRRKYSLFGKECCRLSCKSGPQVNVFLVAVSAPAP